MVDYFRSFVKLKNLNLNSMRIYILLLFFLASAIATPAFSQSKIGDIKVKTLEGQTVSIRDYIKAGRPTIISFWATWCSPCKRELDAMAELYEDWQKQYGVQILAISIDDARSMTKVKPMVEQKGWKYTILSDADKSLHNSLNVVTVPHTFLLNGDGAVIWNHSGYAAGDELELEEQLIAFVNKD